MLGRTTSERRSNQFLSSGKQLQTRNAAGQGEAKLLLKTPKNRKNMRKMNSFKGFEKMASKASHEIVRKRFGRQKGSKLRMSSPQKLKV